MPLVEKDAVDDAFDGLIDGCVLKDNVGRFAAEFQCVFFGRAGKALLNHAAHVGGAGKRNLVDARMFNEGCASLASAGHDIDDSGWQVSVADQLGQFQRGQRRRLGRFQHHRVAASQRRRDLPCRHQQREVPRDDLPGHAQWFGAPAGECIVQFVRPSGVIEEMGRRQWNIDVPGFPNRFAAVQRFDRGKFPGAFLQHSRDPVNVLAAFRRF